MYKRLSVLLGLVFTGPSMTGCLGMSSYQNARVTEPGPARPTFAASRIATTEPGDGEGLIGIDLRSRRCVSQEAVDVGFAGNLLFSGTGPGAAVATVGFEPRFALANEYLLVGLPVNWVIGLPFVQVGPGIVGTLPVSRKFEINASARMVTYISEGAYAIPAYSVGVGFSDDLHRWAIRPEVSFMPTWDDDDEGWLVQVGVGIDPPVVGR